MIKDWSVSAPYSHLAGGMKYHDGKLTVPTTGRYYVYLQVYYQNNGRVYIRVNSKAVSMAQSPSPGKGDEITTYAAGVFNLKSGLQNLQTSSRLLRLTPTVKFTCIPTTPTLARI